MNLLFMGLGMNEILVIGILILLLFGGRKIPELMRGLGRGIREFNDAKSKVKTEIEEGMSEKDAREAREAKEAQMRETRTASTTTTTTTPEAGN